MAVSNVITQAMGNEVRSCMSVVDFDGVAVMAAADTLGITVQTIDAAGVDVNAAEAVLFTAAETTTNHDAMAALTDLINAGIDGANAYFAENAADKFVIHVEAQSSPGALAVSAVVSTPVITVA
jgi:hypothetical protein